MYISIILLAVLALVALWVALTFNKLVAFRTRMEEAWSVIDVFLKKRYDLLPNLMDVVMAYAAHEKETLENVISYRNQGMQAKNPGEQIAAEKGLAGALGRLMAVTENYPDLKANEGFLNLQNQLAGLEVEISTARRYYNGTVRENNIAVQSFPSNLVAGTFHFAKGEFFEISEAEKAVPRMPKADSAKS